MKQVYAWRHLDVCFTFYTHTKSVRDLTAYWQFVRHGIAWWKHQQFEFWLYLDENMWHIKNKRPITVLWSNALVASTSKCSSNNQHNLLISGLVLVPVNTAKPMMPTMVHRMSTVVNNMAKLIRAVSTESEIADIRNSPAGPLIHTVRYPCQHHSHPRPSRHANTYIKHQRVGTSRGSTTCGCGDEGQRGRPKGNGRASGNHEIHFRGIRGRR